MEGKRRPLPEDTPIAEFSISRLIYKRAKRRGVFIIQFSSHFSRVFFFSVFVSEFIF